MSHILKYIIPYPSFCQRHSFVERGMAIGAITLCILLIHPSLLSAQNFTQTIKRTARFTNTADPTNELKVYNIQGNVTVEGYSGNEISITVQQEIEGTDSEIKQAREELELVVKQDGSNVYVYLNAPFITVTKKGDRIHYQIDDWDDHYSFLHDITVRVPERANIYASTINNGFVTVRNTTARVSAFNVNGKVTLLNIAGTTKAHTVNGDINIQYKRSPANDSDYKTVNGTIEVNYPSDLSADIRFKSLNGELYTDFKNIKRLKAQVKTDKRRSGGAVRYKVDKFAPIRIGNGGPVFSFEVLNGNVFIKQTKS